VEVAAAATEREGQATERATSVKVAAAATERATSVEFAAAALDIADDAFTLRTAAGALCVALAAVAFAALDPRPAVVLRDSTCIELRVDADARAAFADAWTARGVAVVGDARRWAVDAASAWARGRLTTFEFLVALNVASGRLFSAPERYPVLPVVVERGGVLRLAGGGRASSDGFGRWFDGSARDLAAPAGASVPPELYGSLALLRGARVRTPAWAPSVEHFVYHYRQSLESPALAADVAAWAAATFGVAVPRAARSQVQQRCGAVRTQGLLRAVDRVGVIGNFQNVVVVFTDGARIALLLADWAAQITLTPMADVARQYSPELVIARGETFIVGYDSQTLTVFKAAPDQRTHAHNYAVALTSATVFQDSVVFVVDFHDVFIGPAADFPDTARHFCGEIEPIARIVADACVGILVVQMRSGRLKIMSLIDASVFGEMGFDGQHIGTILITEVWHLIVLEVGLDLHIATIYGKVLKTVQLFKPIERAITFRICNGNDFVAFVDGDRKFQLFEVLHPEKLQIVGKTKADLVALEYLRAQQLILLIESNGMFSKVPFPVSG
jgi:hypothetical protein